MTAGTYRAPTAPTCASRGTRAPTRAPVVRPPTPPVVFAAPRRYVNDVARIAAQPQMTAINSCIEIDLTGQVCSDSIGSRVYRRVLW